MCRTERKYWGIRYRPSTLQCRIYRYSIRDWNRSLETQCFSAPVFIYRDDRTLIYSHLGTSATTTLLFLLSSLSSACNGPREPGSNSNCMGGNYPECVRQRNILCIGTCWNQPAGVCSSSCVLQSHQIVVDIVLVFTIARIVLRLFRCRRLICRSIRRGMLVLSLAS